VHISSHGEYSDYLEGKLKIKNLNIDKLGIQRGDMLLFEDSDGMSHPIFTSDLKKTIANW
jgi:hypothetical protein